VAFCKRSEARMSGGLGAMPGRCVVVWPETGEAPARLNGILACILRAYVPKSRSGVPT
jgi:hypothetical protein